MHGKWSILGVKVLFLGQFVTKGYGADGVMSDLVSYTRRPEDVSDELVATVATNS